MPVLFGGLAHRHRAPASAAREASMRKLAARAVHRVGAAPRKKSSVLHEIEAGRRPQPQPVKPKLAPMVEIGRLAAHLEHAVDRGGAANHLAARDRGIERPAHVPGSRSVRKHQSESGLPTAKA